jgi:hypothetical protein
MIKRCMKVEKREANPQIYFRRLKANMHTYPCIQGLNNDCMTIEEQLYDQYLLCQIQINQSIRS